MRCTYASEDPKDYPSDVQALVQEITDQRATRGVPLGPLYQTLLISPSFTRTFHAFMQTVRYDSTVPTVMRELAMSRVGALNGAAYEWAHHHPLMVKAGVSEEGAETVRTAKRGEKGGGGGLNDELWVVLRYCDAVTDLQVDDGIFNEVKGVLGGDERKCVELSESGFDMSSNRTCSISLTGES